MAGWRLKYELRYERPVGWGSARHIGDVVQEYLKGWGRDWHRVTLKKHFEDGAFREYGYARRDPDYEAAKLRMMGHTKPLFGITKRKTGHKGGELRRRLLGYAETRSSSRQLRVKLRGTRYFDFRGERGTGPDKRLEVITLSDGEQRALGLGAKVAIVEGLESLRVKRSVRF